MNLFEQTLRVLVEKTKTLPAVFMGVYVNSMKKDVTEEVKTAGESTDELQRSFPLSNHENVAFFPSLCVSFDTCCVEQKQTVGD